jgi:hypothetical protein
MRSKDDKERLTSITYLFVNIVIFFEVLRQHLIVILKLSKKIRIGHLRIMNMEILQRKVCHSFFLLFIGSSGVHASRSLVVPLKKFTASPVTYETSASAQCPSSVLHLFNYLHTFLISFIIYFFFLTYYNHDDTN